MKDNKTKRVTFRVTEDEYKKLEELAYGSCRLLSVYCRDCVFGHKIIVIPGVDQAIRQLRHIGNNLNQIARHLNEWQAPYPDLAKELRNAAVDLTTLKFDVMKKVGDTLGNVQTYQL